MRKTGTAFPREPGPGRSFVLDSADLIEDRQSAPVLEREGI